MRDKRQCVFCETRAKVWVSFVSASGQAVKVALCQDHAKDFGLLDATGYALIDAWSLQPGMVLQSPPTGQKNTGNTAGHTTGLHTDGTNTLPDRGDAVAGKDDKDIAGAGMGSAESVGIEAVAGESVDGGPAGSESVDADSAGSESVEGHGADGGSADDPDALPESLASDLLDTAFSAMVEGLSEITGGNFNSISVQLQGIEPLPGHPGSGAHPGSGVHTGQAHGGKPGTGCPHCGFTLADWKQSGRLGCPHCYGTFAAKIKPQLPHLHGGRGEHLGKIPRGEHLRATAQLRVAHWQRQMEQAVRQEAYEQAAHARDQIREIKEKLLASDA